jgi:KDO2-lipid IV(A) lauroyltransferase
LEPPFWTDSELPKKEAVLKMTSLINSRLEKWIRTYPEEWFWLHNRWKWTDRLRKQENKI